MRRSRFIITVDHLEDHDLVFFGWVVAGQNDEFTLYRRERDGEHQVVQKDSPRYFILDDPNDAQQMCDGNILIGPTPVEPEK